MNNFDIAQQLHDRRTPDEDDAPILYGMLFDDTEGEEEEEE